MLRHSVQGSGTRRGLVSGFHLGVCSRLPSACRHQGSTRTGSTHKLPRWWVAGFSSSRAVQVGASSCPALCLEASLSSLQPGLCRGSQSGQTRGKVAFFVASFQEWLLWVRCGLHSRGGDHMGHRDRRAGSSRATVGLPATTLHPPPCLCSCNGPQASRRNTAACILLFWYFPGIFQTVARIVPSREKCTQRVVPRTAARGAVL